MVPEFMIFLNERMHRSFIYDKLNHKPIRINDICHDYIIIPSGNEIFNLDLVQERPTRTATILIANRKS